MNPNITCKNIYDCYGSDKQWVNWKYEITKEGKQTKVPYSTWGERASSMDPTHWSTLEEANANIAKGFGIGFIFPLDKSVIGIDLDKCFSPNSDGFVENEFNYKKLYERCNSFAEVSPSKKGLHIFLQCTEPVDLKAHKKQNKKGEGIEVYNSGRYFTCTRDIFSNVPIRKVTPEELDEILKITGYPWASSKQETNKQLKNEQPNLNLEVSDQELLEKIYSSRNGQTVKSLLEGDISQYNNDESVADMALCGHLAFWTAKNADQMERIWKTSVLGSRDKTQKRDDYVKRTINKAISNQLEVYNHAVIASHVDQEATRDATTPGVLSSTSIVPTPNALLTPFSEIDTEKIEWIWPGYIAKGKSYTLTGQPGTGKSTITIDFAMRFSTGTPFPGEQSMTPNEPMGVIILSCEDNPHDTIKPRLVAAGAKVENVFMLKSTVIDKASKKERVVALQSDAENIAKCIDQLTIKVGLIIIDPISAYLGEKDSNNNSEIRGLLATLENHIMSKGIALIMINHFNKNTNAQSTNDRSLGSTAFNAVARATFFSIKDPEDETGERRIFGIGKNNLAKEPRKGFYYTISSKKVVDKGVEAEGSYISWDTSNAVEKHIDDYFGKTKKEPTQVDECRETLMSILLENGKEIETKIALKQMQDLGFSRITVYRVARELKLTDINNKGRTGVWKLE